MFITGTIKYGERTWVLRSSSTERFRDSLLSDPDPGPDYPETVKIVANMDNLKRNLDAVMVVSQKYINPHEDDYIFLAYYLFKRFKYLFADFVLGYYERIDCYSIIHNKSSEDAFKLVAVELGFMYDVLYTKATTVYSRPGRILRSISFFSSVFTLVAFSVIDKHAYPTIDITVTYLLIVRAIVLEVYALAINKLSDWTKLRFSKPKNPTAYAVRDAAASSSRSLLTNYKRWSGAMAQYNLISYCLKDKPVKCIGIQKLFRVHEILEKYYCRTWTDIDVDLQELIFSLLLKKSNKIKDDLFDIKLCKQLLAERGDCVLERKKCLDKFRWCTVDVEFDHSLLLWHIATDICYYDDINSREDAGNVDAKYNYTSNVYSRCKISKCLSDYMLYLLVMWSSMLPKGIGEIRYRDTCAEAMRFFNQKRDVISSSKSKACKELLLIDTSSGLLEEIKGDRSQSMLFYGCRLAKQLQSLESKEGWKYEQKWKMISEVWVEMLAYAANHCGWKEHGQQLRKGGELLTHVCLLMAHLGLSEQYQIQKQYIHCPADPFLDPADDPESSFLYHNPFSDIDIRETRCFRYFLCYLCCIICLVPCFDPCRCFGNCCR